MKKCLKYVIIVGMLLSFNFNAYADDIKYMSSDKVYFIDKKIDNIINTKLDLYKHIKYNLINKYYLQYENLIDWNNIDGNNLLSINEDNSTFVHIESEEEKQRIKTELSRGIGLYSLYPETNGYSVKHEVHNIEGRVHQNLINLYVPIPKKDLLKVYKKINDSDREILDNINVTNLVPNKFIKGKQLIENNLYLVTVTLTDDLGEPVDVEFKVFIEDNEAPNATTISDITIYRGKRIDLTIPQATDNIDENPDITIDGLPDGITFDKENNKIVGKPLENGEYEVNVKYTDNSGNSSFTNFKIVVIEDVCSINEELEDELNKAINENKEKDKTIVYLKDDIKKASDTIAYLKDDVKKASDTNAQLNNDIDRLLNKIKKLEEEISNISKNNGECCINPDEVIKKLESKLNEIKNDKEQCSKETNNDLSSISNQIGKLTERINNLKDISEDREFKVARSIKHYQWFPDVIVRKPTKIKYKNNEIVNLEGLIVKFSKYKKTGNTISKESVNVEYKDLINNYKGWEMILNTKTVSNKNERGVANVNISFILRDPDKAKR